jgi:hypothetical protein
MGKNKVRTRRERGSAQRAKSFRWLIPPTLVLLAASGFVIYLAVERDRTTAHADPEAQRWAWQHWQRPIPPQGAVPSNYLPQAGSLMPEDCGTCHPAQYADWKASLHSLTMGPGVMGQFPTLAAGDVQECQGCHAPLSEQYRLVDHGGTLADNSRFDAALAARGLTCSACHLRRHQRHGPPLLKGKQSLSHLAHGEPVRTPHFEASEFCMVCHQHPTDAMLVNGKPVENTYNEWLASPQAADGKTCQQCHMPERRHLWKGIHDPEMTRSGVTIDAAVEPESLRTGLPLRASLTLTNTGTGHAFPTYTTPAVYLRAALLDERDRPLSGFAEEKVIQRRLDMSTVPWREAFDTRIHPGKSVTLNFQRDVPPEAKSLYLWVWVDPDQFYNGFFQGMLQQGDFPGRAQIEAAHAETVNRQYLLWSRRIPIEPRP